MENLPHSRHPIKFNSKTCNGDSNNVNLMAKTVYEDIYGGPQKFGVPSLSPRAEDYSEIFGSFSASRGSSIPVLDLPVFDEVEVSFDVRSSSFDYSEVFGGFDDSDYAVSYEELFDEFNGGGGGGCDFSEEASWTPAETESLSGESDHSRKNASLSTGDPYLSVEDITELSMSCGKVNQRLKEDMLDSQTQTSQLHDVPGFTRVDDETTHLQKTESESLSLKVPDDGTFEVDLSEKMRGRQLMKTMSHPPPGDAGRQTFVNDLRPQREYHINGSRSKETFVTVSEISLRTEPSDFPAPSRPPPMLNVKKDYSSTVTNASEETAGNSSPPYLDVEIDASSSAAVSAAVMEEAMTKAQAKLKSAKDLMDRKKEGFQGCTKPGSKNGMRDKEEKTNKIVIGSDSLNFESMQGVSEIDENGVEQSIREKRQNIFRTTKADPESPRKELLNVAQRSSEVKYEKELQSSQVSDKIDGSDEWKEATQFFELVTADKSTKALEQENDEKIMVKNRKTIKGGHKKRKAAIKAFQQQEDKFMKVKAVEEDFELDQCDNKFKVGKKANVQEEMEACELEENNMISKARKAKDTHGLRAHEKKEEVAIEVCELEQKEQHMGLPLQYVGTKKKIAEDDEPGKHVNMVKVHWKGDKFESDLSLKKNVNSQKLKGKDPRIEDKKKFEESLKSEDSERTHEKVFEKEEKDKGLREAFEEANDVKIMTMTSEQEQNGKRFKKVLKQNENEKTLKEASEIEENEKVKEALVRGENERRLKESLEREEGEKRQKEAIQHNENEKKQREAHDREENEKRLKGVCRIEETELRLKAAHAQEDKIKSLEAYRTREESETRLQEASEEEEIDNYSKEATGSAKESDDKELEKINRGQEENNKKADMLKFRKQNCVHLEGEDISVTMEALKLDNIENPLPVQSASKHAENVGELKATQKSLAHENDVNIRDEVKFDERKSEKVATRLADIRFKASGMAQGTLEHEGTQLKVEGAIDTFLGDGNVKILGEADIGTRQTWVEKIRSVVTPLESHPVYEESKFTNKLRKTGNTSKQIHVATNQVENKGQFTSSGREGSGSRRKAEVTQREQLGAKENTPRTGQQINNVRQGTEGKENSINETITVEEKENARTKIKRALEKDRLRKIEEEREREREREKDRMAVDRATLEAREMAYVESRERAEKAAVERAEFHQRALTEARERLEKVCAEARERSLYEKASMETRLRAERAAVERATAEARERAVEKAAFEARERVEKSVYDKLSASSRNTGVRQNSSSSDLRNIHFHQSMSSSTGSRYPYSTVYGGSSIERSGEGVEGESAQRCRARLERHQRTAERAAKALAEKNMRDLLAQREQAERNRFAETLDADVRRWSSGKEGNLRALVSTLQYILGPNSGWQPIPLTEVITAAAVKKAYRKATLCVHPDKLQQRGASIQQKYICEKVFDLLKEAWNRFNSEER